MRGIVSLTHLALPFILKRQLLLPFSQFLLFLQALIGSRLGGIRFSPCLLALSLYAVALAKEHLIWTVPPTYQSYQIAKSFLPKIGRLCSNQPSSPQKRQRYNPPTPSKTSLSQPLSTSSSPTRTSQHLLHHRKPPVASVHAAKFRESNLEHTVPCLYLGASTSEQKNVTTPDHIRALFNHFGEGPCSNGCIPASVFDEVRALSQDTVEIPTRARDEEYEQDHSAVLIFVKDVYADVIQNFCRR